MDDRKRSRWIGPLSLLLAGVGGSLVAPVLFREVRASFGATSGVIGPLWAFFFAGAAAGTFSYRLGARGRWPFSFGLMPLFGVLLPFLPSIGATGAPYILLLIVLCFAGFIFSRFAASAATGDVGVLSPASLAAGVFLGSIFALRFLPAWGNRPVLVAAWVALAGASIAASSSRRTARERDVTLSVDRPETEGEIPFFPALLVLAGVAIGLFLVGAGRVLDMVCGATMRMELIEAAAAAGGIAAGFLAAGSAARRSGPILFAPAAILAAAAAAGIVSLHGAFPGLFVDLSGGHGYRFEALLRAKEIVAALIIAPCAFFAAASVALGARGVVAVSGTRRFAAAAAGLAVAFAAAPSLIVRATLPGDLLFGTLLFFLIAVIGVSRRSGRKAKAAVRAVALLGFAATLLALVQPVEWQSARLASGAYRRINTILKQRASEGGEQPPDSLLYYGEGRSSTYAVASTPLGPTLLKNGSDDTGDGLYSSVDILLGRLPLLFRPAPPRILLLGAGRGITAGSLLEMEVDSVLVVEPEEERIDATRALGEQNGEYWTDRRFHLIRSDPGRFLGTSTGEFELIIAQPYDVWSITGAVRGTEDFYRKVKGRLAKGGIFSAWVPLIGVGEDDVKSMLATIAAVFPRIVAFQAARHDGLVVLAGEEPFRLRVEALVNRWRGTGFGDEFATAGISAAADLMPFARFDETAGATLFGAARLNDRRKTPVEFGAEMALADLSGRNYLDLIRSVPWDGRSILDFEGLDDETKADFLYRAGRAFRRTADPEHGYPFAEEAYRLAPSTGRALLLAYFVKVLDGDMERVLSIEEEALRRDPDNGMMIRNYADDLFVAGRYEKCIAYMTDVIDRGFEPPWCYLIRGKAYTMLDRLDEAIRDIGKAKELDRLQDRRGNINYFLGMAYKRRGDLEKSNYYLSRAIGTNPRHYNARYNFGENKVKLGKLARDEFEANYYAPFNRSRADSLYRLASADFFRPEKAAQVERDLVLIINTTPNHMGAYLLLAEFYWRAGNDAKEGEAISRMVSHFQGSAKCLALLDNYLARTGGPEKRARYRRIIHDVLSRAGS